MHLRGYALAISLIALTPLSAGAATIMENFTLLVPSTPLPTGDGLFAATSFAKFNPALGTLDSFSVGLTGAAVWTSTAFPDVFSDNLSLAYNPAHVLTPGQIITTSGSIHIDLSGGSTFGPDLSAVSGAGTTNVDLIVEAHLGDFFVTPTPGLVGSITYDYTPAAISEPTTLGLFCASLAALVVVRRRTRIRP